MLSILLNIITVGKVKHFHLKVTKHIISLDTLLFFFSCSKVDKQDELLMSRVHSFSHRNFGNDCHLAHLQKWMLSCCNQKVLLRRWSPLRLCHMWKFRGNLTVQFFIWPVKNGSYFWGNTPQMFLSNTAFPISCAKEFSFFLFIALCVASKLCEKGRERQLRSPLPKFLNSTAQK